MKTEKKIDSGSFLNEPTKTLTDLPMKVESVINSTDTKSERIKVLKDKCNFMYNAGLPFELSKSGSTYQLTSKLYNDKAYRVGMTPKQLAFIRSVKTFVDNEGVALKFIDDDFKSLRIDYIKVNDFNSGDKVEDLVYIDINGAYWKTAYNLGVISSSIYKRGLDTDKVVRLAALGGLAKRKDIWRFNGKEFKKQKPIRSISTENIWFAICKRVSDVMSEVAKKIGSNFVFYWVDGIYVKNDTATIAQISEMFLKYGYTTKMEYIPYVEFGERGFKVQGAIEEDVKNFCWSIDKVDKKPITTYIENHRLKKLAESIMYGKKKQSDTAKNDAKMLIGLVK
jgi:hypothetical protein